MTSKAAVELRAAERGELARFVALETETDTAEYILPWPLARHRREFERDDIVYLTILRQGELAGFFILALEEDSRSVEFRRIVVADKGAGIGQRAIRAMEAWCRERLGRDRIWLDVFAFNLRGRHVYEKLGYRLFDRGEVDGKPLLYLQKSLR